MSWLATVGYGIGIIAALGASSAWFAKNRGQYTNDLLESEVHAQKDVIERQADEIARAKQDQAAQFEKNQQLTKQVEYLKGLVDQTPQMTALTQNVLDQHKEVVSKLTDLASNLADKNGS